MHKQDVLVLVSMKLIFLGEVNWPSAKELVGIEHEEVAEGLDEGGRVAAFHEGRGPELAARALARAMVSASSFSRRESPCGSSAAGAEQAPSMLVLGSALTGRRVARRLQSGRGRATYRQAEPGDVKSGCSARAARHSRSASASLP